MPQVLIVAYGNPLRSDDGVAWRAAEILDTRFNQPDVEIRRLHQLTPELAETVSHFERVIFIDAASSQGSDRSPGLVRVEEIGTGAEDPSRFSHALSPQRVVGMAAQLYGACPPAFVVTVTGASFDHGTSLSPSIANSLPELISTIEQLVGDAAPKA